MHIISYKLTLYNQYNLGLTLFLTAICLDAVVLLYS
jgi:hypothetical protein